MSNNFPKHTCLLERIFIDRGFVLIHDGLKNPVQFELPEEEVRFFTRRYRLMLDGIFVNTWATFRHDLRTGWSDFEVTCREPRIGKGKQTLHTSSENMDLEDKNAGVPREIATR